MDGFRKKSKKKMRFKDFINESIIDIPRRTYAPKVFDDADTKNPKIKDSVKKQIANQLKEFESEYPILKTSLIGSIQQKDIEMTQTWTSTFCLMYLLTNKKKKD